jgi:hypothetical protein
MEQVLYDKPCTGYPGNVEHNEAHSSGVSWSAVIAGAAVTAALSLILLALGAGPGANEVPGPNGARGSNGSDAQVLLSSIVGASGPALAAPKTHAWVWWILGIVAVMVAFAARAWIRKKSDSDSKKNSPYWPLPR